MDQLIAVVAVRCRACGRAYAKPHGRSTTRTNPGCPQCGHLGWVPADEDVSEGDAWRRSDGDQRPRRVSRPG